MSETRQDPSEADPADRRHGRAPRTPGRQPSGPADDQPRPPAVLPPTPPYGTPAERPTIPPTPPYGTPVPGAPDYGRSGPAYGPGHREGWSTRSTRSTGATGSTGATERGDDPAPAYPRRPRRRRLPTGVKLLVGAALVVTVLLTLGVVLDRLTDLSAGPFTDTVGRASTQDGPRAPADADPADPAESAIAADEWAAIARDPAGHRGERIRVAGVVTRLWSADDETARATVGGALPSGDRKAETPVALTGSEETFRSFRVDDEVMLRAVVVGENDTGMPVLRVEKSSVLRTG
jgi:hypothetical protein